MKSMKGNPDKGPQMKEGAHSFDKGYVADSEYFSPDAGKSDSNYRGNRYMEMQNEIVRKDDKKMKSDKFSKIA